MWRSAFLALSTNRGVHHVATRSTLAKKVASRFIAGETLTTAIEAAREINRWGASVELDYLGESVLDERQAEEAAAAYLQILDAIAEAGVGSHVSLKPSQMGQELSDTLCEQNIESVVERAAGYGSFVWVDMESSPYTERTVELYKRLRARHENVGIALQAYLHRCKADLREIVSVGGTIRLCKGAYQEPAQVAFPEKRDVDRNYALLSEMLLTSGLFQALGTHDEKMIDHTVEFVKARDLSKEGFEFQMLYGVRRDLQEKLIQEGYNLRVYVPFGDQWYPYFMRRLAERPANLFFLMGNLAREAMPTR